MSWETINHIATWACAMSALACAIVIWMHIIVQRRFHATMRQTLAEMNAAYREGTAELNTIYRDGYDIVTHDLALLKERVAELER